MLVLQIAELIMYNRQSIGLNIVCAFAVTWFAADVTGDWEAVAMREGRAVATSFSFKVEGGKLTGTVKNQQGRETEVADGKVKGDQISFTIVRGAAGNPVKFMYSGTVSGDEIQFKLKRDDTDLPEFQAKRVTK